MQRCNHSSSLKEWREERKDTLVDGVDEWMDRWREKGRKRANIRDAGRLRKKEGGMGRKEERERFFSFLFIFLLINLMTLNC